jgi:hypothetical protein
VGARRGSLRRLDIVAGRAFRSLRAEVEANGQTLADLTDERIRGPRNDEPARAGLGARRFRPGDILDGDAEAETSGWWAKQYGCGVQSAGCTASVTAFNHFLTLMTEQEKIDLGSLACATATSVGCVVAQVHSTDNGTGRYQLSNSTVEAMGDLITLDAYPDEGTTELLAAASAWHQELDALKSFWAARGIPNLTVLVGEWGYRNHHEVTDTLQQEVVYAEVTKASRARAMWRV